MLLRSSSDMVHGTTLHKTLISTSLIFADQPYKRPHTAFSPAYRGFRITGYP
nr:MAG TPA: hypothetical protein [Caudoviricetes sp.]